VDSTYIIELPGRSPLAGRLEGSSRRQAHYGLAQFLFFFLTEFGVE
jgi:hypothetical protein